MLRYDNMLTDTAPSVKELLIKQGAPIVQQPPFSKISVSETYFYSQIEESSHGTSILRYRQQQNQTKEI